MMQAVLTPKKPVRVIASILAFITSRSIVHLRIQASKFHKYLATMSQTSMLKLRRRKAHAIGLKSTNTGWKNG